MSEIEYTPGRFVWRELMTSDPEKARGFYGELFGWTYKDVPMADGSHYTMIHVGETGVGGLMKSMGEHPPHWMSYVSVEDVDASTAAAKKHGGMVAVGPLDIPDVGRFAVIGDPDHAYLTVFKSSMGDPDPNARPSAGHFCWETLTTKDLEKAKTFYGAVVGWTVGAGPLAKPDMPLFYAGDAMIADLQKAEHMPPSWATYVVVDKVDDAAARVAKLGGHVAVPPFDVPTVGRIAFFADPTGAFLGLFEPAAG